MVPFAFHYYCLAIMVLGGYVGTQWSMAFQGMLLGLVGALLGIWAIIYAGGFSEISAKLYASRRSVRR